MLVVGIGASAGGLEAFKKFFDAMPTDTGMAFVLVQHLSPDYKSRLSELLGKSTTMAVVEATDGIPVKPNCVFVIPPDATMTIRSGCLKIVRPAPPREHRRPVDTFFLSLAEDQGANAVCIILSGTGSDGSIGLTAVKEHGGLTLAQAEYDSHAMPGMPESASNTGLVDDVLPVDKMPDRLISYQRHLLNVADGKNEDGVHKDVASQIASILHALHARTGYDFSEYKEKTLMRRLQRRMQVLQMETPEAYRERLKEHPEELDVLLRELLISVTSFFRDPASFEALGQTVIKDLVASKSPTEELRVWVPGCATGEEVYTIAILIREAMGGRRPRLKVQIFGSDLDERAISVARLGRYRRPLAGISEERLERWFTLEGEDYCILPEIREMCVFSVHSVIKHPPFSKVDLISCRNLLIYLENSMQDRLMQTFHYALKPQGKLFLGSSESVTRATKLFRAYDKKHRIFERRDVVATTIPLFSEGNRAMERTERTEPDGFVKPDDDHTDRQMRMVTEKHSPPHLLLDKANRIVRFAGGPVGVYLEPMPGPASFALFDILRKGLRHAARDVLQQVRAGREAVRRDDIPIRIGGNSRLVNLLCEPLSDTDAEGEYVVLSIQDAGSGSVKPKDNSGDQAPADALHLLEQDLRATRTQLQSTIDELETANEEMKSSNEEYQSVNEELQSSNEELETAKEEMQSINEELHTINTEIASKNEQLTQLNSDLSNLLESTEIATLFLDDSLRVRRFTRGVNEVFHLRDTDIGRPITEIVSMLDYRELKRDVKIVQRKLTPIERQVTLEGSKTTFILGIRPYRSISNVIDGVVLTFVDISQLQAATEAVRASEEKYRMLFNFIDEGFCILEKIETRAGDASDYRYLTANPGFEQQSGISNPAGKSIREIVPGEAQGWCDIYDKVFETGDPVRFERELIATDRFIEAYAFRFEENANYRVGVIFLDVTDRKRHAEQQELLLQEMDHRIKNLFSVTGSIVSLSQRTAKTPTDMGNKIQGRLTAMSQAHNLVRPRRLASSMESLSTNLDKIITTILEPLAGPDELGGIDRVILDGPHVDVCGDAVASLSMVLHELATNAAKYGSLSKLDGRVSISWSINNHFLEVTWIEQNGPKISHPPEHEGFGSSLARSNIVGQLSGRISYDWQPTGLVVTLIINMQRLMSKYVGNDQAAS